MSRWSGSTRLDAMRLYSAVHKVVNKEKIIENVSKVNQKDLPPRYQLDNVLIRKVAGAMVLEEQKKAVKRQALVDRVLAKQLPKRVEDLNKRKGVPHIPWYYQVHDK